MTGADWAELQDAWLSDYGLLDSEGRSVIPPLHHSHTLIAVAAERGIRVRGLVAENKKDGAYVQPMPDGSRRVEEGGTSRVVYIGRSNRFTKKDTSKWAPPPVDER